MTHATGESAQSFGVRFDHRSGGTLWYVELANGEIARGYAETSTEAMAIIDEYRQAAVRELRRRGPRSPWGGSR